LLAKWGTFLAGGNLKEKGQRRKEKGERVGMGRAGRNILGSKCIWIK
jgi:hypothetical protein